MANLLSMGRLAGAYTVTLSGHAVLICCQWMRVRNGDMVVMDICTQGKFRLHKSISISTNADATVVHGSNVISICALEDDLDSQHTPALPVWPKIFD